MPLEIPAGNVVGLRLFDGSAAPLGNAVGLALRDTPVDSDDGFINSPIAIAAPSWRQSGNGGTQSMAPAWRRPPQQVLAMGAVWRQSASSANPLRPAWQSLVPVAKSRRARWRGRNHLLESLQLGWFQLLPRQGHVAPSWVPGSSQENNLVIGWRRPPPQYGNVKPSWVETVSDYRLLAAVFNQPTARFTDRYFEWGPGCSRLPTIHKPPVIFDPPPPVVIPPNIIEPPPGNAVGLGLVCPVPGASNGAALSLPLRRIHCLEASTMVFHTGALTRVSDGAELFPIAAEVSIDRDSWAWTFSAMVPMQDLPLIENEDGQPVELQLNLNGHIWLVYAEEYAERDVFNNRVLQISGRSVSAELSRGYSLPADRDEDSDLSAFQLAAQELVNTGWTLTHHPSWQDYPVPGGTFRYRGLAPIDALSRISEASGAFLLPMPDRREIRITPRYPVAAWLRNQTQPDVELSSSMILARNSRTVPEPIRRGIYVAGQNSAGHLVQVKRAGTDGEPWAEMITDALITDPQAGLARAITELSNTGRRRQVGLTIPLFKEGEGPGVLMPSTIVNTLETATNSWTGQVAATSISARWENAGTIIRQQVSVERYTDE
jgi:hypothetical protein